MIGYKFVQADEEGRFWSAMAERKACVEYKRGKWTYAPDWLARKGYHLFAFDNLEEATTLKEKHSLDFKIFECEAEKIIALPQKLRIYELSNGVVEKVSHMWPFHTIMAERIKLVEEIV